MNKRISNNMNVMLVNRYGITVKKCCASCQHKCTDTDGRRICGLMQIVVEQKFDCPKWELAEGQQNAGRSGGKVKRREYLMFVFETRMQEQEAIEAGKMLPTEVATLDSLRKRFEEMTGLSPYMIH